jgi:hypothetical protein
MSATRITRPRTGTSAAHANCSRCQRSGAAIFVDLVRPALMCDGGDQPAAPHCSVRSRHVPTGGPQLRRLPSEARLGREAGSPNTRRMVKGLGHAVQANDCRCADASDRAIQEACEGAGQLVGRGFNGDFSQAPREKSAARTLPLFEFMLVNATKSSLWRLFVEKEDS